MLPCDWLVRCLCEAVECVPYKVVCVFYNRNMYRTVSKLIINYICVNHCSKRIAFLWWCLIQLHLEATVSVAASNFRSLWFLHVTSFSDKYFTKADSTMAVCWIETFQCVWVQMSYPGYQRGQGWCCQGLRRRWICTHSRLSHRHSSTQPLFSYSSKHVIKSHMLVLDILACAPWCSLQPQRTNFSKWRLFCL